MDKSLKSYCAASLKIIHEAPNHKCKQILAEEYIKEMNAKGERAYADWLSKTYQVEAFSRWGLITDVPGVMPNSNPIESSNRVSKTSVVVPHTKVSLEQACNRHFQKLVEQQAAKVQSSHKHFSRTSLLNVRFPSSCTEIFTPKFPRALRMPRSGSSSRNRFLSSGSSRAAVVDFETGKQIISRLYMRDPHHPKREGEGGRVAAMSFNDLRGSAVLTPSRIIICRAFSTCSRC